MARHVIVGPEVGVAAAVIARAVCALQVLRRTEPAWVLAERQWWLEPGQLTIAGEVVDEKDWVAAHPRAGLMVVDLRCMAPRE